LAALVSASMVMREALARATASRPRPLPRPTCSEISAIACINWSDNWPAAWFMAREPSAARAVSSKAARTASSAASMSSALNCRVEAPTTIGWMPPSVATSTWRARLDKLTRRDACQVRSRSL